MVIATELARRLEENLNLAFMLHVLHHDADECRTGDLPGNAKERNGLPVDRTWCPWIEEWADDSLVYPSCALLVRIADHVETLTWIERWGIGAHANRAALAERKKIEEMCPPRWGNAVGKLIKEIEEDMGR
jgi:hypothetical protein